MEQILFTKNDLAIFLNMESDVAVVRYEGNSLHSFGPWKAICHEINFSKSKLLKET